MKRDEAEGQVAVDAAVGHPSGPRHPSGASIRSAGRYTRRSKASSMVVWMTVGLEVVARLGQVAHVDVARRAQHILEHAGERLAERLSLVYSMRAVWNSLLAARIPTPR